MISSTPFAIKVKPNWESLVSCIRRECTPQRVHHIELFLDEEIKAEICKQYSLLDDLQQNDKNFNLKREIVIQRFLGYDYVRCSFDPGTIDMVLHTITASDTAQLQRDNGREYIDEHHGPITNWQEFEAYPWPDPKTATTGNLQWYQENLPDDMCIIGSGGFAHFAEYINWLMGYETLCYALYEQRDLVKAITDRLIEIFRVVVCRMLEFDRVKIIWGSDDMGFRSGTLISPDDLREFVLPGHKLMAQLSHDAGRPYLLHSCGKLDLIMDDLINDVCIDAKHSFEDTIENVIDAKQLYGDKIAMLGGIDLDFLCQSDEQKVRSRVRQTLEKCHEGGGYCLGTGNSVANYVPLKNYFAMIDEGRNFLN